VLEERRADRAGVPRDEARSPDCSTRGDAPRVLPGDVFLLAEAVFLRVCGALCAAVVVVRLRLAGLVFFFVAARGITILLVKSSLLCR
jgi:hypothetical protein